MPHSSPHPISICHSSLAPAPRAPPLFPSLSVTSFRAPALMSHSSSGSSPEIGMGRVAELQSRARHISYSPRSASTCSASNPSLLPSLHIQLLYSVFLGAPASCSSFADLPHPFLSFYPPVSPHLPPPPSSYLQRWTQNPLYPRVSVRRRDRSQKA